jgi:hypothetical protein
MNVLCEWWTTVKEHEGILQFLGRDSAAGNVSNGCLVGDNAEQLTTLVQDCIMLTLFYNGSEEEGRKNFQKFYDLSK